MGILARIVERVGVRECLAPPLPDNSNGIQNDRHGVDESSCSLVDSLGLRQQQRGQAQALCSA